MLPDWTVVWALQQCPLVQQWEQTDEEQCRTQDNRPLVSKYHSQPVLAQLREDGIAEDGYKTSVLHSVRIVTLKN